jgi:hypothetical protein
MWLRRAGLGDGDIAPVIKGSIWKRGAGFLKRGSLVFFEDKNQETFNFFRSAAALLICGGLMHGFA